MSQVQKNADFVKYNACVWRPEERNSIPPKMFACSRLVHMGGKTKTPSICNRTCPRGAWSHFCDIHCMGQNGKQISDVGGRAQPESRFVLCRACVRRVCLYFGPKLFGRALACTLFLFGPGRFCLFFPPAPQSPISSFSWLYLLA